MERNMHITRGHLYSYDSKTFLDCRWEDTGEEFDILSREDRKRPCAKCGVLPTVEGHDACIANLPGVAYACCGHGDTSRCYIKFEDGTIVRGEEAQKIQQKLKGEV